MLLGLLGRLWGSLVGLAVVVFRVYICNNKRAYFDQTESKGTTFPYGNVPLWGCTKHPTTGLKDLYSRTCRLEDR